MVRIAPRQLLLLRFVIYENNNLCLAGSETNLAEVFSHYQCEGNRRRYHNGSDQDHHLLLHVCFSLPFDT